ncbi:MAG: hypothetical protein H0U46_04310 [Actinobacteria bacterium]|nr:hypothetical protein [Actinomycetota bacterium]
MRYSEATQEARETLVDGSPHASSAVAAHGLRELDRRGTKAANARPKPWWSFEGFTEVDCCLATDRVVLFIEGKRKEALSESTSWYRGRNQLIRNLEAIGDIARGRACGVVLVSEKPLDELDDEAYARALPHLSSPQREAVRDRYLGQLTWEALCEVVDIPFHGLPDERQTV